MEKFCPLCSRVYGVEISQCEVDGERLVVFKEEPSFVGHVLDSKYTLISKLGEGGMGSVYLAEQTSMGREVAIKVLRREFSQNRTAIKRFLREARAASKLTHPNTITVYDFGQSNDGLLYLVMERLIGRPLGDILDEFGPMPVDRAVHILAQMCDSLSEAHAHGITHRDLKPENIFIEQNVGNPDFVKVLDFGIAKMQGEDNTQATATGMICGTPSYMSPEQAMGRDIDGRSDIYALGVLLYEMLTDVKPFDGDTPMEVMLKHINEPPPPIMERARLAVPAGIQETIDRMLAKGAEHRPEHCQELKRLLIEGLDTPLVKVELAQAPLERARPRRPEGEEQATALEKTGLSPVIPPEAYAPRPRPEPKRRPFIYALAAVAVLALGGVAAALVVSGSGSTQSAESLPVTSVESVSGVPSRAPAPAPTRTPALMADGSPAATLASQPAVPPTGSTEELPGEVIAKSPAAPVDAAALVGVVSSGRATGAWIRGAGDRALHLRANALIAALPEEVTVTIRSTPTGAVVADASGEDLGTTPLELKRPRDSGELELVLRLERHNPRSVKVAVGATDVVHDLELTRARRAGGTRGRDGSAPKPPPEDGPKFPTF